MAQIVLNATAAQSTRIQQAVDAYNLAAGTNLTPKQWIYEILRQAVVGQLSGQIEAPAITVRNQINTDMAGGT